MWRLLILETIQIQLNVTDHPLLIPTQRPPLQTTPTPHIPRPLYHPAQTLLLSNDRQPLPIAVLNVQIIH